MQYFENKSEIIGNCQKNKKHMKKHVHTHFKQSLNNNKSTCVKHSKPCKTFFKTHTLKTIKVFEGFSIKKPCVFFAWFFPPKNLPKTFQNLPKTSRQPPQNFPNTSRFRGGYKLRIFIRDSL